MTDTQLPVEHQWCDAWLLVAAALASGEAPASLGAIIAAADAVQHAIPEFEEVDGGLARLSAADLLHRGQRGFALTGWGAELMAQTEPGGSLKQQKALEKALKAAPWSATYSPRDASRASLPPVVTGDEYTGAVEAYAHLGCVVAA
jgi:hypothetical protein